MSDSPLLQRLKERKIVQWIVAYLAGGWVLVEATSVVVDQFHWPAIIGQAVTVLVFFGFFVTLILAWYHGEKGRQRVSGPELLLVAAVLLAAGGVLTVLPGEEEAAGPRGPGPISVVDTDRPSIAILPLENMSPDPDDAYFAVGMHEELTTRISQISALFVISRSSVEQFRDPGSRPTAPEIARDLGGIDYLLEGSARIAGGVVRIAVQLIDGTTDGHVWSDTFDGPYSVEESIAVQSEIAREIANALQVEVTPDEVDRISGLPTEDLEAYQLYLLGLQRFYARSSENLREAIQFFEAALQKDSAFAEAWAGLAITWNVVPWYDPIDSREAFARGREAAQRALELNENLAEVHTALGGQALFDEWNWEKAVAHFSRALELNPNHAQAYHWISTAHRTLGLLDRAIEELEEGIRHNPLGNNFQYALANYLYDAGRIEEALVAYRKAATLEPPVPWGLLMMTVFLVQQDMTEEALRIIEDWGELIGYPDLQRLSVVIEAFEVPELREEALEVLEDVKRETGLLERDVSVASLNFHEPAEILRITRELIAQRYPGTISLGLPFTKAKLLETPGVLTEFEAVGIPLR